jgi:hypothetical protein
MLRWAFLANRALWHNKAKVRGYGELFRSGDTVTVVLDLDHHRGGTLSFSLNGRPMGIAAEGLTGPLYPAFSLYNEDDSITIAYMKSSGEDGMSTDRGRGTSSTEKLLKKMDYLGTLMGFLQAGYDKNTTDADAAIMNTYLQELVATVSGA